MDFAKWPLFSNQQEILTMFKCPGNHKGVAGVKKQTDLYPYKCRSKSPTSSAFTYNRLSNSNSHCTYDLFTTRRAPVNSISWLFG